MMIAIDLGGGGLIIMSLKYLKYVNNPKLRLKLSLNWPWPSSIGLNSLPTTEAAVQSVPVPSNDSTVVTAVMRAAD